MAVDMGQYLQEVQGSLYSTHITDHNHVHTNQSMHAQKVGAYLGAKEREDTPLAI